MLHFERYYEIARDDKPEKHYAENEQQEFGRRKGMPNQKILVCLDLTPVVVQPVLRNR